METSDFSRHYKADYWSFYYEENSVPPVVFKRIWIWKLDKLIYPPDVAQTSKITVLFDKPMKWEYLSFLDQRLGVIIANTWSVIVTVHCICLMPGTVLEALQTSSHWVSGGRSSLHGRQVNGHAQVPSTAIQDLSPDPSDSRLLFHRLLDVGKFLNLSEPGLPPL